MGYGKATIWKAGEIIACLKNAKSHVMSSLGIKIRDVPADLLQIG
jgi:hypothetical protein